MSADLTPEGGGRRCALRPDQPAAAVCTRCLKPISESVRAVDDDGLAVCQYTAEGLPCPVMEGLAHGVEAPPRLPPAPAEAPPEPTSVIPWESPLWPSPLRALWATLVLAVLAPFQYMEKVPWVRRDLKTPALFALSCTFIGQSVFTLRSLNAEQAIWASPGLTAVDGLLHLSDTFGLAPMMALLPLMVILELTVSTALSQLGLTLYARASGGAVAPAEATFRVFAYGRVTYLLLVVPLVGALIGSFLDVILLVGGLRIAHRASFGRALFALALPFLLQGALLIWSGAVQA